MKRVLFVLALLGAVTACQKEYGKDSGRLSLIASFEQQITRTAIGDENSVVWCSDDQVKVTTTTGSYDFYLTEGAGSSNGKFFSEEATGVPGYAIYPASSFISLNESTIEFSLPETQIYAENSFGGGANVAVAKVADGNMPFKNACGILKLQLKGCSKISRIELSGGNDEYLWGVFSIDAANAAGNGAAYVSGGGKTIVLDCSANGGVSLDPETPKSFYFVVPTGAFGDDSNGGFTAIVYDGENSAVLSSTKSSNKIERSCIKTMPALSAFPLPTGYTAKTSLIGTGTQYIFGPVIAPNETTTELEFVMTASGKPSKNTAFASIYPSSGGKYNASYTKSDGIGIGLGTGTLKNRGFFNSGDIIHIVMNSGTGDTHIATYQVNGGDPIENCRCEGDIYTVEDNKLGIFNRTGQSVLNGTNNGSAPVKMHYVKCYLRDAGHTLLNYLIPAVNSESEGGLYDVVTKTFYTNEGSGVFETE